MTNSDDWLDTEILKIIHLVGCQTYTAGWNDRLDKKDLDLTKVDEYEANTVKELKQTIQAHIDRLVVEERLHELLNMPFNDNRFDFKWLHEHWAKRIDMLQAQIAELNKQLKDK